MKENLKSLLISVIIIIVGGTVAQIIDEAFFTIAYCIVCIVTLYWQYVNGRE